MNLDVAVNLLVVPEGINVAAALAYEHLDFLMLLGAHRRTGLTFLEHSVALTSSHRFTPAAQGLRSYGQRIS